MIAGGPVVVVVVGGSQPNSQTASLTSSHMPRRWKAHRVGIVCTSHTRCYRRSVNSEYGKANDGSRIPLLALSSKAQQFALHEVCIVCNCTCTVPSQGPVSGWRATNQTVVRWPAPLELGPNR